jgi:hypothetical protein
MTRKEAKSLLHFKVLPDNSDPVILKFWKTETALQTPDGQDYRIPGFQKKHQSNG